MSSIHSNTVFLRLHELPNPLYRPPPRLADFPRHNHKNMNLVLLHHPLRLNPPHLPKVLDEPSDLGCEEFCGPREDEDPQRVQIRVCCFEELESREGGGESGREEGVSRAEGVGSSWCCWGVERREEVAEVRVGSVCEHGGVEEVVGVWEVGGEREVDPGGDEDEPFGEDEVRGRCGREGEGRREVEEECGAEA